MRMTKKTDGIESYERDRERERESEREREVGMSNTVTRRVRKGN